MNDQTAKEPAAAMRRAGEDDEVDVEGESTATAAVAAAAAAAMAAVVVVVVADAAAALIALDDCGWPASGAAARTTAEILSIRGTTWRPRGTAGRWSARR